MIVGIFLLLLLSIFFSGCGHQHPDPRLSTIEEMTLHSPNDALDSLSVIDYDRLSESDRHYYDFLLIKSRDKAFVKHTSDSLILKVIDYEENNKENGRYTEALYYGGRVYHDIGDLPTALNYYQTALDRFGEREKYDLLRGNILCQIADLLNALRLYDKAIPYAEESIEVDSARNDSINLMYSTELLGSIYLHAQKYALAEKAIRKAKGLGSSVSLADTSRHNVYLAALKYYGGDVDSALYYIRSAIRDPGFFRSAMALSYAGLIYKRAEISDSTLLFADKLIKMQGSDNRRWGFNLIYSPEMKDYVSPDTLLAHLYDYWNEMEKYLNKNGEREALIQNSFYNYRLHQRKRLEAESSNRRLYGWLVGCIIFLLLMGIVLLLLRNRNKSQLLQLHEAIGNVNRLRKALEKHESKDEQDNLQECGSGGYSGSIEEMRVRLREELLALRQTAAPSISVAPDILESKAYGELYEHIKENRILPENSQLWIELEEVVMKSYPKLRTRLNILSGGKMKPTDFHLVLQIKCGISPTNIAGLVGRAKSTIAYRKDALVIKLFGQKMEHGLIEDIIRLL